jgi:bifunctional non-homologous end joining protein LigD
VYSVRPNKRPTVSAPVTWKEIERGIRIEDFHIDNMAARLKKVGDLWKPLLARTGRVNLEKHIRAGNGV